jgi:2-dehydropantoate 2-reductase
MKTLVFGAGPLGSLYAHLLNQAGKDVTLLARGNRYDWISENGLVLVDEFTGTTTTTRIRLISELTTGDEYDLVIVLIRKNKLAPVFETLAANGRLKNILFMGNNALGFDAYLKRLPVERVLFGFPGAGGGLNEQLVHYVDREKANGKRISITLGEVDGTLKERTQTIKSFFETSGIPVDLASDIDGWLKYHVALVSPLVCGLYKHDCDNLALAKDKATIRQLVRGAKEGGRVLEALGYVKRQPFRYNLFYWLPEFLNVMALRGLLVSRFAEVAFARHARAAQDEMSALVAEFQTLIDASSIDAPNLRTLGSHVSKGVS